MVGGVRTPTIRSALDDPALELVSLAQADAYPQRYSFLTRRTLHAGAIEFAPLTPPRDVALISTEAMLAARDDVHPAIVNLLLEVIRDEHDDQGYFEAPNEFPNVEQVDLRVSPDAVRHRRFGPSLLYRYLPFWVATFVERFIIIVVPLLVVMLPVFRFLPQVMSWRVRSRIYRWYGELTLLERDVRLARGRAADRALARRPRADPARRRARPDAGELRERGLYAARAHRPRPARGHREGGHQELTVTRDRLDGAATKFRWPVWRTVVGCFGSKARVRSATGNGCCPSLADIQPESSTGRSWPLALTGGGRSGWASLEPVRASPRADAGCIGDTARRTIRAGPAGLPAAEARGDAPHGGCEKSTTDRTDANCDRVLVAVGGAGSGG